MLVWKEWTIKSVLKDVSYEHIRKICDYVYNRWDFKTLKEATQSSLM